jgi:predicted cupin superfamily sugar epimerase
VLHALTQLTAAEVIGMLDLAPHPEGGFYRETYRDRAPGEGARPFSTAIYFLLPLGEISAWHRVDAAEVWNFYAGRPLKLSLSAADGQSSNHILGVDLFAGQRPQCVVPAGVWQKAEAALISEETDSAMLPAWSLVGCTVAPGFDFSGFELAQPGWQPA